MCLKKAAEVRFLHMPNFQLGFDEFEALEFIPVELHILFKKKHLLIGEAIPADHNETAQIIFSRLADLREEIKEGVFQICDDNLILSTCSQRMNLCGADRKSMFGGSGTEEQ